MDEGPQEDEPNRWDDPRYGKHVPIEELIRRKEGRLAKTLDDLAMPDLFPGDELDEFLVWLRQIRDESRSRPYRDLPS